MARNRPAGGARKAIDPAADRDRARWMGRPVRQGQSRPAPGGYRRRLDPRALVAGRRDGAALGGGRNRRPAVFCLDDDGRFRQCDLGCGVRRAAGDLRGLRGAYRTSLLLFAAGSAACALAPNIGLFLAGRVLQGLGGGLLTALAYTTISAGLSGASAYARDHHGVRHLERGRPLRTSLRRDPRRMGPVALGLLDRCPGRRGGGAARRTDRASARRCGAGRRRPGRCDRVRAPGPARRFGSGRGRWRSIGACADQRVWTGRRHSIAAGHACYRWRRRYPRRALAPAADRSVQPQERIGRGVAGDGADGGKHDGSPLRAVCGHGNRRTCADHRRLSECGCRRRLDPRGVRHRLGGTGMGASLDHRRAGADRVRSGSVGMELASAVR